MSLLVIDFTYLEGNYGELVVKELAAVDSHSNRVSSYVFKRAGMNCHCLTLERMLLTMGVIGMMVM